VRGSGLLFSVNMKAFVSEKYVGDNWHRTLLQFWWTSLHGRPTPRWLALQGVQNVILVL